MSTLAVIPARLGSTRLPRKPLRLLHGAPLIVRVWERIRDLRLADRCVIATDSEEVVSAASRVGAECVMTDPEHLSGTDRVAEVAAMPAFARYDVIVNIQGDEPFIQAAAVLGATHTVASGRFPLGTVAMRASRESLDSPSVVKVICADDGRALYFSRAGIPFLRDVTDTPLRDREVRQHVGIYAYTRDALARWVALPPHPLERIEKLEQLRPLAAGIAMGVADVDGMPSTGVDTEDDLIRANQLWPEFTTERG